eukprot:TRINITY_DN23831_c0_g1_i1.p1 TRINITY_DN23831_c0_g1~~TRINITY_DN23831_c0_g1_i1.p1  ORF type:complete len:437 (+),score=108.52 TRINITY_DN23831_c0_g1_i1:216-1526(+)
MPATQTQRCRKRPSAASTSPSRPRPSNSGKVQQPQQGKKQRSVASSDSAARWETNEAAATTSSKGSTAAAPARTDTATAASGSRAPVIEAAVSRRRIAAADAATRRHVNAVAAAIAESSSVPQHIAAMLRSVAGASLAVKSAERHPHEESVVEMIGEALAGIEADLDKASTEAELRLESCRAAKAARDADLAEAERGLALADCEQQAKACILTRETDALTQAKQELSRQKQRQAETEAAAKADELRLNALESAARDGLEPFKCKAAEDEREKANVQALVKAGIDAGLEHTLMNSIVSVLQIKPDLRGPFDAVVLLTLQEQITENVAKLKQQIEAADGPRRELVEEVSAAQKAVEAATVLHDAAIASRAEALKAELSCRMFVRSARRAVTISMQEVNKTAAVAEGAQAKLAAFRAGPVLSLRELRGSEEAKEHTVSE